MADELRPGGRRLPGISDMKMGAVPMGWNPAHRRPGHDGTRAISKGKVPRAGRSERPTDVGYR